MEETPLPEVSHSSLDWQTSYLMIPNAYFYRDFGVIITGGKDSFQQSNGAFTADISGKLVSASIEFKTSDGDHIDTGDLTMDVLDIICAFWIRQVNHAEESIWISTDDILKARKIKPQKSGTGRRGGYKAKSRKKIANQVDTLANIWITITAMQVVKQSIHKKDTDKYIEKTPALIIVDKIQKENKKGKKTDFAWKLRLGDAFADSIFGKNRQTALLSNKAVEYNHKIHTWEKRLTRYLSWIWRNRQATGNYMQPFEIKTLLKAVQEQVNEKHPNRAKDRLEKALDKLQQDEVISGWEYEKAHSEEKIGKKGWIKEWLQTKIVIEPPAPIFSQYAKIRKFKGKPAKKTSRKDEVIIGELASTMQSNNLSKLQISEQIGVSVDQLSQVLTHYNKKKHSKTVDKIQKWLKHKSA